MTRIHVLDEVTVSHIAAGEVVERAASIVKELCENAVDAGASRVTVDVFADKSAVSKIVVTDNGAGLSFDDALLAFRQHATSKISSHTDLGEIVTLGFRGEALASIAAVSRVTLVSRERGSSSPEGVRLVIHGGEVVSHSVAGVAEGTCITVEDVFFNTPARKKFQKSVSTELSHIYDIVERIALVHTGVAFVLLYQGKERLRTFGNSVFSDVIAGVFGTGFVKELVPVEGSFGVARVSGFVTAPGREMKSTPSRFYFSVNGRQVVSRSLQWAVREGYGTLLPNGMYPAAFLHIELDPHEVDVNVHPTKREIRFSRERDVMVSVQDAVYSSLHEVPVFPSVGVSSGKSVYANPDATVPKLDDFLGEVVVPVESSRFSYAASLRQTDKQLRRTEGVVPAADVVIPEVLGQVGGTYILARDDAGSLLIVDQHAAHERIMYDRLLANQGMAGQELLVPVQISLSRKEAAALPDVLGVLADAGYVIEPFGEGVWSVRSVPVVSDRLGSPEVIHEILAEAIDGCVADRENALDRVLKTAACRAVVKGNTVMSVEQMERLLRQLYATKSPFTCPHGRPTVIVLSREKLEKMFLRA